MYTTDKRYFAFNIWDTESIQAVIDAASENGCEVILQTSSRIFKTMEQETVRSFVMYYSRKKGINEF